MFCWQSFAEDVLWIEQSMNVSSMVGAEATLPSNR
jgi:hypothetical protein